MPCFFSFSLDEGRLITWGMERFFVFQSTSGSYHLIPDKCPHRGGYLSRGTWDNKSRKLRCPWHKTALPERAIFKLQIPAIVVNKHWTAYLSGDSKSHSIRVHNIPVVRVE